MIICYLQTENTSLASIGSIDTALAQLFYRVVWNHDSLIALSALRAFQFGIKGNNSWLGEKGEDYSTSFCGGTGSPLRIAISCTQNATHTNSIRHYLCSLIITPPYWHQVNKQKNSQVTIEVTDDWVTHLQQSYNWWILQNKIVDKCTRASHSHVQIPGWNRMYMN